MKMCRWQILWWQMQSMCTRTTHQAPRKPITIACSLRNTSLKSVLLTLHHFFWTLVVMGLDIYSHMQFGCTIMSSKTACSRLRKTLPSISVIDVCMCTITWTQNSYQSVMHRNEMVIQVCGWSSSSTEYGLCIAKLELDQSSLTLGPSTADSGHVDKESLQSNNLCIFYWVSVWKAMKLCMKYYQTRLRFSAVRSILSPT